MVESPHGERLLCVIGAPTALLETYNQDHLDEEYIKEYYKSKAREFATCGIRSLAIARKRDNDKWVLLGMAPLLDPPRPHTASAPRVARALGISIKLFTSDAVAIAKNFTQSIGMGDNVLDANTMDVGDEKSDLEVAAGVEAADAYAEISGTHRVKIIQALQSHRHWIAVTGDGVTDVPALKRPDCGIAIDVAAEKAQSASDVVFVERPGRSPIVLAIQTSRQTVQQVHNCIAYRTTLSLHQMFVMLWYLVAYSEILDVRLLLLNTHVSDVVTLSLASEKVESPFSKEPQRWSF